MVKRIGKLLDFSGVVKAFANILPFSSPVAKRKSCLALPMTLGLIVNLSQGDLALVTATTLL